MGVAEVLTTLRRGGELTKADLVRDTSMPRSTVNLQLDQLLASGLAIPSGIGQSSGGRRPSRFAFNADLLAVVVLDFGATHGTVAVTDLSANIKLQRRHDIRVDSGPVDSLTQALVLASSLLEELGITWEGVLGVGIGVPGPVEHSKGVLIRPPIMPGWDAFNIPRFVQEWTGLEIPTLVDNDVNILTLGEHASHWRDTGELLYVKVSTGIGAGLIQRGEIQRGAQGSAGDLGQVQVPHTSDDRVLEQMAGMQAVCSEMEKLAGATIRAPELLQLLRNHDTQARALTRDAGRTIGEVVAICVNMLNPAVVVIGGRMGEASEDLIAGVRETVYKRSTPLSTQELRIVAARGGGEAAIIGAANTVIEACLSVDAVVEQLQASHSAATGTSS